MVGLIDLLTGSFLFGTAMEEGDELLVFSWSLSLFLFGAWFASSSLPLLETRISINGALVKLEFEILRDKWFSSTLSLLFDFANECVEFSSSFSDFQ